MAIQTGLEGRPWFVGALVGLLVAIGVYVLTYQVQLKTMKQDIARKEAKLAELQTKIQEGRAAAAQLPQFREEVRRLELELDKLLRILPARRNTPELLRRIRSLAEQGNFNLRRFRPGGFADQDFYSEWPIAIDIEGNYHNLALFFDRISRFSRIINIENLKINSIKNPTPDRTITASFNAKTFVYKESEPEPPAEPQAARKGRRRGR